MYEIKQKIDRNFVLNGNSVEFDNKNIYVGKVTSDPLERILGEFLQFKKMTPEMEKFERHANNSDIKFRKTRFSWTRGSYIMMKDDFEIMQHPLYKDENEIRTDFISLL